MSPRGAYIIGAIYDDEINDLFGINGMNETVIYERVVGKKVK